MPWSPSGNSLPSPTSSAKEALGASTPAFDNPVYLPPILKANVQHLIEFGFSYQSPACHCSLKATDFCPYCDLERSQEEWPQTLSPILDALTCTATPLAPILENDIVDSETNNLLLWPASDHKLRLIPPRHNSSVERLSYISSAASEGNDTVVDVGPHGQSQQPLSPRPERRTSKKLEKRKRTTSALTVQPELELVAPKAVTVVKSKSFLRPNKIRSLDPQPKPIPECIQTNALVSLAWTGQTRQISPILQSDEGDDASTIVASFNSPSDSSTFLRSEPHTRLHEHPPIISRRISEPLLHAAPHAHGLHSRRSVLRKSPGPEAVWRPVIPAKKSWSLATAITDDKITDEKLVSDLEAIRIRSDPMDETDDGGVYPLGLGPPPTPYLYYGTESYFPLPHDDELEVPEDPSWTATRKALLICRELVRTERNYLKSLKILIGNGTRTPAPSDMLSYLPGLITASEHFLQLIEENPSVQGVSEAFLASFTVLSDGFIQWSAVVGFFFGLGPEQRSQSESEEATDGSFFGAVGRKPSRGASFALDNRLVVIPEPNKIKKKSRSRPTVQDVAIMPTQRIMRYVLLFKELYALTPTHLPSHSIVQQAMNHAQLLAQRSDEAQVQVTYNPFAGVAH